MSNNQQNAANSIQHKNNASGGELSQKQIEKTGKPMTPAMQKIDEYRDMLNAGYQQKIMADNFSSVVYLYESDNKVCAVGYKGRSKKAAFRYHYKNDTVRLERVTEWMGKQKQAVKRRKPEARTLNVGDVLYASWGYEQTNINYYLVKKLIGKCSVEIVEIARHVLNTSDMTGHCLPDVNTEIGKPFIKRVDGGELWINSFIHARKKQPEYIAGCRVFNIDYFSTYA